MQIKKSYVVRFDEATTLDDIPYYDWRREKYIGYEGVLFVVKEDEMQHIQWNMLKDEIVDFTKGLVSSNGDVTISNDTIKVKTENSYYYFSIIDKKVLEIDQIKLW